MRRGEHTVLREVAYSVLPSGISRAPTLCDHCALPRLGEYCIFVCALTNALEAMIYRDTDTKVRR